jgi:Zn-finger nucleic acid-binding protein
MWRDGQHGAARAMPDVIEHSSEETDSRARLCPECGRLLRRAKVGRGIDFHLDRCGHCGGVWFDPNEWETLRRHGLHDDVHFVFSAAWQAEVARQDRDTLHQKTLERMLGSQDLAEIHRIKHWLGEHPRRAELLAVLITGSAGAMTKQ